MTDYIQGQDATMSITGEWLNVDAPSDLMVEPEPKDVYYYPEGTEWFLPRFHIQGKAEWDGSELLIGAGQVHDLTDYGRRARLMRWLWHHAPGFQRLYLLRPHG